MPDADKLTPADPSDLASALAYALRYQRRKRVAAGLPSDVGYERRALEPR